MAKLGRPVIRRLSDLASESLEEPGSWRCLELVYRNQPAKLLDRFFLGSRSARGTRNRLQVLKDEICKAVEERAHLHNPVRLISFGSGPGHEVLECIERLRDRVAVQAVCVDKEPEALEHGRYLASQRKLNECVSYLQGNILRRAPVITGQDIGILSGLTDYFDFRTALSVLARVREALVPGGLILLANMRQHGLARTMSILGNWDLVYREPDEVEGLLRASGYEEIKVWLEPEKVFSIGKATKPRQI